MHRIDTPTAQKDKFGVGKNGFTRGNPQTGTPATDLDDDYFDMLQEELATVIESAAVPLDKSKKNQLLTALKKLLLSRVHPFSDIKSDGAPAITEALMNLGLSANLQMPGSAILPLGLELRWGNTPAGSVSRAVNYLTPFPGGVLVVVHFDGGWHATGGAMWGATNKTASGFTGMTSIAGEGGQYLALGY